MSKTGKIVSVFGALIIAAGSYFLLTDSQQGAETVQQTQNLEKKSPPQAPNKQKPKQQETTDHEAKPPVLAQVEPLDTKATKEPDATVHSVQPTNLPIAHGDSSQPSDAAEVIAKTVNNGDQKTSTTTDHHANGKFSNVSDTVKFQDPVIQAVALEQDKLDSMIERISTTGLKHAIGRFYLASSGKSAHASTGMIKMEPITPDAYEALQSMIGDATRKKHGFGFHFAFNVWDKSVDVAPLEKLLQDVGAQKEHVKLVLIRGHADEIGSDEYNRALSLKRASLIANALPNFSVIVEAVGEKEPVADDNTEQGRAMNRRVEVVFIMQHPNESSALTGNEVH